MDGVLSIEKKSRARLHASPPQYTATDPGALGGRSRVAIAINNHDEIIGTAEIIDGDLAWPLSWKRRPFAQPPVLLDDIDDHRAADHWHNGDSSNPRSGLPRGEESDWGFPATDKEYD